jgi:hypothetical protein
MKISDYFNQLEREIRLINLDIEPYEQNSPLLKLYCQEHPVDIENRRFLKIIGIEDTKNSI